ncbi:MAG: hypothetical protein GF315_01870 [candidate division Zixibacteria bacterium]|nr:hypothetical protein [candidate division Zixibacteria bacterium]
MTEGLFFFEAPCAKVGIQVERDLDDDIVKGRSYASKINDDSHAALPRPIMRIIPDNS